MLRFNVFLISAILFLGPLSHSEIRTTLEAQNLSFISPDYDSSSKNFAFIGATLQTNPKPDDTFRIDFTGMYAMGNSVLSYMNPREIYYTTHTGSDSNLEIGRVLKQWSALDSAWNLGVYQPQFRWNQLKPENQGLTGLFWSKEAESYGLTLFASPLFIPDQGAGYELKDGQFQSGNPFFQAPPQNIRFQGQLLPIDYQINKPEINDVVSQSSFGAQARYGKSAGFFANIAGMVKPANQLALGYKGVLVTTRVRVDITPKTYFENVYSTDMGYRTDTFAFMLSALYSKPQNPEFDSSFNAPQFEPSTSFGPQILFRYKTFDFYAAYLDTAGGDVNDVGPDASPDRDSLSERFLFKQAALLSVAHADTYFKNYRVDSSFQYKFSSKESFQLIRFNNKLKIRGPWAFLLDLILINTNSAAQGNMEVYKSQDQVWLGVSYDL